MKKAPNKKIKKIADDYLKEYTHSALLKIARDLDWFVGEIRRRSKLKENASHPIININTPPPRELALN